MIRYLISALLAASFACAQPLPSYKNLKYPPLPQVKIPEPVQFTLSNGMRVFLLEDHELPLIHGLALIHTGNLFDPPDKRGLSEVMADVMRSGGTKARTGDQIDEQLEDLAASVESSMEETSASMSFSALKESADAVLATFKEVMTDPEFRQDKIDLELSQLRSAIARRNDDANSIPGRELMDIIYGRNTPYGWETEYEHLARIHREDLIAFYRRFYFPKNIMLAVYGDFPAKVMQEKLEKLFGTWNVQQPPAPPFPPVTAKPAPGVYLAEKSDVTQTFFALGELGGTLRDKDYPALQVAADILGQGFSSRLVSQIRTKLGYAYDISAGWDASYNHPGTFRIAGSTKSASTTETIQAIDAEIEKMRTTEVTERELSEAKDSVMNSFVFFFDSPAKTLNRVMRYEYFGYPKDFLFEYRKAIDAVTRADVQRVAKEHFRPENLTVVAVGNPQEFGKPLSALGKVQPIDLTIPEPPAEPAKPNAETIDKGRELLRKAQNTVGGADKLLAVKDVTELLTMAMDPSAGGLHIKQTNRYLAPSYFRQDQELPFGKISAYFDGKTGWLVGPQGPMGLSPPVVKQVQGVMFRILPRLLTAGRESSTTIYAISADTIEISEAGGMSVKLQFDPATGLPARLTYAEAEETLSDWRDVDGLKMPFKIFIEQNGKKFAELTVDQYKFNTGLKVEDLSKRP